MIQADDMQASLVGLSSDYQGLRDRLFLFLLINKDAFHMMCPRKNNIREKQSSCMMHTFCLDSSKVGIFRVLCSMAQ